MPALNIAAVLKSIPLLMADPNPDDGLMADIVGSYASSTVPPYFNGIHCVLLLKNRKRPTTIGEIMQVMLLQHVLLQKGMQFQFKQKWVRIKTLFLPPSQCLFSYAIFIL